MEIKQLYLYLLLSLLLSVCQDGQENKCKGVSQEQESQIDTHHGFDFSNYFLHQG